MIAVQRSRSMRHVPVKIDEWGSSQRYNNTLGATEFVDGTWCRVKNWSIRADTYIRDVMAGSAMAVRTKKYLASYKLPLAWTRLCNY